MEEGPSTVWSSGLELKEDKYEGVIEDVEEVLDKFRVATVTTYGTRKSRKAKSAATSGGLCNKENKPAYKVKWSSKFTLATDC